MRDYKILKAFPGSQDGIQSDTFIKGTVCGLSDSLAEQAVKAGWAVLASDPEARETKVVEPKETKQPEKAKESEAASDGKPDLEAMEHKELLAYAKNTLGLKLKGNPSREKILEAIAAADEE